MNIREQLEEIERNTLRFEASLSLNSQGRQINEKCNQRTSYQQDRDKIIHSKSFRRLAYKTQVFLSPLGDHYTTRLTHTIEVSQISRSIARALRLNEDLAEAIAYGHDLGHTPFGHMGEKALNQVYSKGFHHVTHSVRMVEKIEKNGKGLNLTYEVIDGIKKHSKGKGPIITDNPSLKASTLEGQIVRLADIIAYLNHDLNDAIRAGLLKYDMIPKDLQKIFCQDSSKRINTILFDLISESSKTSPIEIKISTNMEEAFNNMRAFMFTNVYESSRANDSFYKVLNIITKLFDYYVNNPKELELANHGFFLSSDLERQACDFIAGMTDRFAVNMFSKLFIPIPWEVL